MVTRNTITLVLLWLSVLQMSIWFGGTIFNMTVVVPLWSASPPESVRAFFTGTDFNRTIWYFFGPPWMAARGLPVLLLLISGWNLQTHRKYFLVMTTCMIFGLVFTLAYIYPMNAVLFAQAGGNHTGEEIRAMARQWILADRVRFAVMTIGFLALLRALSIPIHNSARP